MGGWGKCVVEGIVYVCVKAFPTIPRQRTPFNTNTHAHTPIPTRTHLHGHHVRAVYHQQLHRGQKIGLRVRVGALVLRQLGGLGWVRVGGGGVGVWGVGVYVELYP